MCNINPCFTYFWVPAVSTGNRSVDGPVPDYVPKLAPTGAVLADCCSGAGSNGQAFACSSIGFRWCYFTAGNSIRRRAPCVILPGDGVILALRTRRLGVNYGVSRQAAARTPGRAFLVVTACIIDIHRYTVNLCPRRRPNKMLSSSRQTSAVALCISP